MTVALFFDTETTGVKRWDEPAFTPQLVQLGAIVQDLESERVMAEVNFINRDCGTVPKVASDIHGITTELTQQFGIQGTRIDKLFADLLKMADVAVAHNIGFDRDIVSANMPESWGLLKPLESVCTMQLTRDIVQAPLTEKQRIFFVDYPDQKDSEYKAPKLTEAYEYLFGEAFDGAHDAMADVRACRDIYFTLRKSTAPLK